VRDPLERSVERRVVDEIRRRGYGAEKWGADGWPDYQVLLGGGSHFWMEFKSKTGRLRKAQAIRFNLMRQNRETIYVPRSYEVGIAALDAEELRVRHRGSPMARVRWG